jgi:hypothetical protein
MDISRILEDCRKAGVSITADFIEGYAELARAKGGSCSPPPRSDFLYDMIHLNLSYLTQVARLGSSYSIFAYRALAALYGTYGAPPGYTPVPCAPGNSSGLCFEGAEGDTQTRFIWLTNSTAGDLTPKFPKHLELSSVGAKVSVKPSYQRGSVAADASPICAGDIARIAVKLSVPAFVSGTYTGTLHVELGAGTIEHSVILRISS